MPGDRSENGKKRNLSKPPNMDIDNPGEIASDKEGGVHFISAHYEGPLPPPKDIKQYENILPGSADRILSMAEKQLEANNQLAKYELEMENKYRFSGLTYGFLSLIALLAGAVICAYIGQTIIAGLFLAAGTIGIVSRFIDGRRREKLQNNGDDTED